MNRFKSVNLGIAGALALVTGGLLMMMAPEAQTMRDAVNGNNRSPDSRDVNDPHRKVIGHPTRAVSGSVPISDTDVVMPGMMREPATTGDTRR